MSYTLATARRIRTTRKTTRAASGRAASQHLKTCGAGTRERPDYWVHSAQATLAIFFSRITPPCHPAARSRGRLRFAQRSRATAASTTSRVVAVIGIQRSQTVGFAQSKRLKPRGFAKLIVSEAETSGSGGGILFIGVLLLSAAYKFHEASAIAISGRLRMPDRGGDERRDRACRSWSSHH